MKWGRLHVETSLARCIDGVLTFRRLRNDSGLYEKAVILERMRLPEV